MVRRFLKKVSEIRIVFPLLIPGMGCGVLGLGLAKSSKSIGEYASMLLRALEYRGYDSTGAAIMDDQKKITLLKDVGAPSTLVKTLGIEKQEGKIFCGQVRWATFGRVDKQNSQPHVVKCKRNLFGAHNGNITNTRELKKFLISEGHDVLSDNDGEMLVHTIEHYFDIEMDKLKKEESLNTEIRKKTMRSAIINACAKMIGSFAAVIVDPETETMYAIKAGSSLYFGIGTVDGNDFSLASSDLTAILRLTKKLVDLKEGEFIEYTADEYKIYPYKDIFLKKENKTLKAGLPLSREQVWSKLRAEDTGLLPDYKFFMEQEIHSETESVGRLIKLFAGGSNTRRYMIGFLERENLLNEIKTLNEKILSVQDSKEQQGIFDEYVNSKESERFYELIRREYPQIYEELTKENFEKKYFFSTDRNTFIDLIGKVFDRKKLLVSKALDSISETDDVDDVEEKVKAFISIVKDTLEHNRNIYAIACGSSFHAAKIGALFFNEIAGIELIPILPGDFRGQYSKSLRNYDTIVGVSQSGETKDLIDVFNDISNLEQNIKKVTLVNNMNSTLGQEKSDVAIPIFCGPEIAVPATKSFMNQIVLFYYLAIRVLELRISVEGSENRKIEMSKELKKRRNSLKNIPMILKETIDTTCDQVEAVANKIYLEPSMHIMATKITGIAKEGALKIRETVLNHAEGGEASEFKHGPNTILGKNTVFGVKSIKALIKFYNKTIENIENLGKEKAVSDEETREIIKAVSSYLFSRTYPFNLSKEGTDIFRDIVRNYDFFSHLYRNYPLVYITGPDERDVNLTISQINTHKIRGADTFVIAEENDKLLENVRTAPSMENYYGWGYIMLPRTGDSLLTCFSSTVVLQLLALRMSVRKMGYLDRLGVIEHGVHPDVPKNVSKSITVD